MNKALLFTPDVIIMDLILPEMSGWETIRHLKTRSKTRKIPVVAISGHSWPRDHIDASGCDAYRQKPCGPAELLDVLRELVARPSDD